MSNIAAAKNNARVNNASASVAPTTLRARRIEPREDNLTTPAGRAAALFELLGLKGAGFSTWTPARGWTEAKSKVTGRPYPMSERTLQESNAGKFAIAPTRRRYARYVSFDLDGAHHVDLTARAIRREQGKAPIGATLDDTIDGNTQAKARRRIIAGANRIVADVLQAMFPMGFMATTPDGLRFVVILDGDYPVGEIHAAGLRVFEHLHLGLNDEVEVFPKPDSSGLANLGRLLLSGCSRLVGRDLVTFEHKRKADDERALLAAPRLTLEAFIDRLPTPSSTVMTQPTLPIELRASDRGGIKILEENSSECVEDKGYPSSSLVYGADFVRLVRRYLTGGIGRGESWTATIKIADVMSNMPWIDEGVAVARFRRLRRVPGHTARHCSTARLWRKREAQFLARFRSNRANGKAHDVSTRSLRAAVDELADGDAVRTGLSVEQAIEIARARDARRLEGCARGGRVSRGVEESRPGIVRITISNVDEELAAAVLMNKIAAENRIAVASKLGNVAALTVDETAALPHDVIRKCES